MKIKFYYIIVICVIIIISNLIFFRTYMDVYEKEVVERHDIEQIILPYNNFQIESPFVYPDFWNDIPIHIPIDMKNESEKYNNKNTTDVVNESEKTIERSTDEKKDNLYDCILVIPTIDLKKYVYSGKNRDWHLEQYELVTASDDMQYCNGGNYIICGHASRLYGHSLNRLKELQVGDNLYIQSFEHIDKYKIDTIEYCDRDYSEKYYVQTNQPIITIISCAKNVSANSYIIIQAKYLTSQKEN